MWVAGEGTDTIESMAGGWLAGGGDSDSFLNAVCVGVIGRLEGVMFAWDGLDG